MSATQESSANTAAGAGKFGDWLFFNLTRLFAALTLILLAGIIVSLVVGSWESIQKFGLSFIWRQDWNPPMEEFGALIPIYGTLVTSLIALVIAVPVSFGIALFLTELSPVWLRRPLG
ncbi:MAG: phosphate ABC transporter permease PstC, partial [Betaproteobacteria bacterium]